MVVFEWGYYISNIFSLLNNYVFCKYVYIVFNTKKLLVQGMMWYLYKRWLPKMVCNCFLKLILRSHQNTHGHLMKRFNIFIIVRLQHRDHFRFKAQSNSVDQKLIFSGRIQAIGIMRHLQNKNLWNSYWLMLVTLIYLYFVLFLLNIIISS